MAELVEKKGFPTPTARGRALRLDQYYVLDASPPPLDGKGRGEARIVHYENHRVEVALESSGRGLLVLSDSFYPGWTERS